MMGRARKVVGHETSTSAALAQRSLTTQARKENYRVFEDNVMNWSRHLVLFSYSTLGYTMLAAAFEIYMYPHMIAPASAHILLCPCAVLVAYFGVRERSRMLLNGAAVFMFILCFVTVLATVKFWLYSRRVWDGFSLPPRHMERLWMLKVSTVCLTILVVLAFMLLGVCILASLLSRAVDRFKRLRIPHTSAVEDFLNFDDGTPDSDQDDATMFATNDKVALQEIH